MTDQTLLGAGADAQTADDAAKEVPAEAVTDDAAKQAADETPADDADKPADDAADEGAKNEKEDDEPQGAPEAYEDFAMPDGVELDTEVLGDFQALGKELNLPQADAQKVADLGAKMAQRWAERQTENVIALQTEWADETKADKEIGGEQLAENLAIAKKARDTFGTPAFAELLEQSGLGNHPEMIRLLVKAGKTITEDTIVSSGMNGGGKSTPAKTLFPNQN